MTRTTSLFVTATGTACGKTWLSRGLARALVRRGASVAAIKPIETGVVDGTPLDALALGRAVRRPELAFAPGLLRARIAASPYSAVLAGELAPIEVSRLARSLVQLCVGSDLALVESAGGLLVPLSPDHTTADLAAALGWPLVLVGRDGLGTLSHVLTALEAAARRALVVRAVVLTRGPWSEGDASVATNQRILSEHTSVPVLSFPACDDDDDDLADAAESLVDSLFDVR